ncbi:MAG: hypothetical protein Q9221_004686 [Calogaya cf. arnoldii]
MDQSVVERLLSQLPKPATILAEAVVVSEFYDSIIPRIKGGKIPDVFGTRDEDLHRKMRRPIANLYSVANLTNLEPLVLSTMQRFFARLDELFTDKPEEFDLCQWLQFFTFDVMGEVTFSHRLGFLENGGDIEGVMENNWKYFQMAAPNTQMPWLDYLWKDNPLLPTILKRNPLADFGATRIKERLSMTDEQRDRINQNDFLFSSRRSRRIPICQKCVWSLQSAPKILTTID